MKKIFPGLVKVSAPILDFILPPVCLHCETSLSDGSRYLCRNCSDSIGRIDNKSGIAESRIGSDDIISNAFSLFLFKESTPIQTLIHSFKYGQMKNIGKYYGQIFAEDVLLAEKVNADYIVPVPLHFSKKRERGYNQSDYICDGLSNILKIPTLKKCLKRKRFTQTQTKLSREERLQNVKDAFKLREKFKATIKRKNIVLVDDVITTGSTILECARILKTGGCSEITVCSIALAE